MSTRSLIQYITSHPLNKNARVKALIRFAKWQINTRINPYPIIYPFTDNAKLIINKGMTGATQNIYCGLHDYEEMLFLLHFLTKDTLFLDIGANVGSYTVLASAHIGAKTISFEPSPIAYSHLVNNISINRVSDKVTALNIGVGSKPGVVNFTSSLDTINHVATNGEENTVEVVFDRLDTVLKDKSPSLIKIDVEGFELEVLNGGKQTLANPELKAVLIELNGSGTRYGYRDDDVHKFLLDVGFLPHTYHPDTRTLNKLETYGAHNTIYIRDTDFVQNKLSSAPKVKVFNKFI